MGKLSATVSVPGADPAASDSADDTVDGADTLEGGGEQDANALADRVAALEAENRRLVAQAAAGTPADPNGIVFEPETPHGKVHMAESKHRDYTTAELDVLVRAGKVKLTEHHVLCKNGWYVNPQA